MKINKQKILISEFKESIHNQNLKPFKNKEGTVIKGVIEPIHFYLYAIIRLSDINKIFHNNIYLIELNKLFNKIIEKPENYHYLINKIKNIFPSLTINDIIVFTKKYKKIKGELNE